MLLQCKNCCDFIQRYEEIDEIKVPHSTFFDAMHSLRRRHLLRQVSKAYYECLDQQLNTEAVDYLHESHEINGYDVFNSKFSSLNLRTLEYIFFCSCALSNVHGFLQTSYKVKSSINKFPCFHKLLETFFRLKFIVHISPLNATFLSH